MVNVSDKTISFKVEEELSEKAKTLIEASGLTAKDWFQKAVALAEMQSVKQGATDFASDLSELEVHTARIYELVANMVQKGIYLRDKAVGDLETLLSQQREITSDYQSKIKEANEERDQAVNDLETTQKEQKGLQNQLNELRETLETNKLLINEYKEKNDTLNGLVTKFQGFADENERLKETLAKEQQRSQSAIQEITSENDYLKEQNKGLEQQIERLTEAHKTALERLEERKDVEQEKALLQAERASQKALSEANNEYTNKIQSLYENMNKQREQYEQKIAELERQLNSERTKNNKSK